MQRVLAGYCRCNRQLRAPPLHHVTSLLVSAQFCPSFPRGKGLTLVCYSPMFQKAYSQDGKTIFYFDFADNKYVTTGGSLAWRLNNPGLVHTTSRFFSRQGSIGNFGLYAIFVSPEKGREALINWLHTKKYFQGSLKTIAKHYKPDNADTFAQRLSALTGIPVKTKVKTLVKQEFDKLLLGIEKLCDYALTGNETLYLMPKILGKIENGENESTYWIGGNTMLSKKEALEWVQTHRLDAVIVHGHNGSLYLRSRSDHWIQHIRFPFITPSKPEDSPSLTRVVGTTKPGQCIWAFINGIDNTKEEALKATHRISSMAGGERVLSMQNDTKGWWGLPDFGDCILLKTFLDLPVIHRAVNFARYLLTLEKEEKVPIVIFAHSQGGIILEHALELLKPSEATNLRIFTFGGGSFIAVGKSHPDSRNYASVADFVCLGSSPSLQTLALKRYHARKEGLTDTQMIQQWSFRDAIFQLDSIDANVIKKFAEGRAQHYQDMFTRINNLTILDPDPGSRWKHEFASNCYQTAIEQIIQKYRRQYVKPLARK